MFERTMAYEKHEEIFENSQMDIIVRNRCGVLRDGYPYEDQIKEEIVLLLEINEQRREILNVLDLGQNQGLFLFYHII